MGSISFDGGLWGVVMVDLSMCNRSLTAMKGHDWGFEVLCEGLRGCMAGVPVAFGAHLGNSHG